tara:strand:- start:1293 stop:1679 length:387 start_codon:yes stop_codon:yes gene_type:complete
MKYSLTKKQLETLVFIKEYYSKTGSVPSVREIADNGKTVLSGGKRLLDGLISRGAIIKGKAGAPRSYIISDNLNEDIANLRRVHDAAKDFVEKQRIFRHAYEKGEAQEYMSSEVQNAFEFLSNKLGEV